MGAIFIRRSFVQEAFHKGFYIFFFMGTWLRRCRGDFGELAAAQNATRILDFELSGGTEFITTPCS